MKEKKLLFRNLELLKEHNIRLTLKTSGDSTVGTFEKILDELPPEDLETCRDEISDLNSHIAFLTLENTDLRNIIRRMIEVGKEETIAGVKAPKE